MDAKKHTAYKLEEHVNDWVKAQFNSLNLKNQKDYYTESAIPDYLKEALKGRAKTASKTNFGKPDFSLTKYLVPVVIENKFGLKKLISKTKDGVKFDEKSVSNYAVNGALYYATGMIASGKYHEVIAIGIAGDSDDDIELQAYYVFGSGDKAHKLLDNVNTLDFLENQSTFDALYQDAILTEDEKHEILIKSRVALQKYAKSLNRLMHNHNVTAGQRVLYVSGMLLSMQDVVDEDGNKIQDGLAPEDLKGIQTNSKRDGVQIVNQINEFLTARNIPLDKQNLMLSSFSEISKDSQRDEATALDKEVSTLINGDASTNKQIFTFIYNNIFLSIDAMAGHLDIMGEMYSEFLKYALGDGKEIGIVLTPPYITKMMATILNVNQHSRVMDLATGSAGFLISSMEIMIDDAEHTYGKKTSAAEQKIDEIKKSQLLGIELNAEMFTLAATNMILRGDGSSNIQKGSSFSSPENLYTEFNADRLLLNPPFSYKENGMPFISFGLDHMEKGGLAAIIIQDSAGSGKAVKTNQSILKRHSLIASIKMPTDLFQPMAGVQTSIYVFEAKRPHDHDRPVKFIDFRNDGYKRTSRSLQEVDNPTMRYSDIIKIYKAGESARLDALWELEETYVEDFITDSGADWNFDQHKTTEKKPGIDDLKRTVSDYLAWEVGRLFSPNVTSGNKTSGLEGYKLTKDEKDAINSLDIINWGSFNIGEMFDIKPTKNYGLSNGKLLEAAGSIPVVSNTSLNNGITAYVGLKPTEKGNIITFSDTTTDEAIFYQPDDFVGYSHVQGMHKKFKENISKNHYLFIVAAFKIAIKGKYSYGSKFNRDNAAKESIQLPVKADNTPDYNYMNLIISAVQKQVIKRVVMYINN